MDYYPPIVDIAMLIIMPTGMLLMFAWAIWSGCQKYKLEWHFFLTEVKLPEEKHG